MQYFREQVLAYNPHHELSTLLHIHIETDRPRVLVPPSHTSNYVDQLLAEYSVPMYAYPELGHADAKLALGVYNQRKAGGAVFQIEESKRKPIKKRPVKKVVAPVEENGKQCPCCGVKVVIKHKCEHIYCAKPCARVRRPRNLGLGQDSRMESSRRRKHQDEEQQFTPEKQDWENEESPEDHESEYEEDEELIQDLYSSDQLSDNSKTKKIEKKKTKSRSNRRQSNKGSRNRRNRSGGAPQPAPQQNLESQQQPIKQEEGPSSKNQATPTETIQTVTRNRSRNGSSQQNPAKITRSKQSREGQDSKPVPQPQSQPAESKSLRRRRPNPAPKTEARLPQDMSMPMRVPTEVGRVRKTTNSARIQKYCTLEQLNCNYVVSIRIIDSDAEYDHKQPSPAQASQHEQAPLKPADDEPQLDQQPAERERDEPVQQQQPHIDAEQQVNNRYELQVPLEVSNAVPGGAQQDNEESESNSMAGYELGDKDRNNPDYVADMDEE